MNFFAQEIDDCDDPVDIQAVYRALRTYRMTAYVTGVMLLLLCVEMLLKYGMNQEIYVLSNYGLVAFVSLDAVVEPTGFNLSIGILIAHGWLYVAYLFANFRLWSLLPWKFKHFIVIALGGVVPFLSFVVESKVTRQVKAFLEQALVTQIETSKINDVSTSSQ